jgi:hypothetical protein
MGFLRKALFVSTGGVSGLVVGLNSKTERIARATEQQVRIAAADSARRAAEAKRIADTADLEARFRAADSARRASEARSTAVQMQRQASQAQPPQPVQRLSTSAEIERLAGLYREGLLTDEEFRAAKRKVIGEAAFGEADPSPIPHTSRDEA